MPRAIFADTVIAESDDTIVVEGNHYFPPSSLREEYFTESGTHTVCPWKGTASYKTVQVGDASSEDAAWYYPEPKDAAKEIAGYYAFWKGVVVEG